jgi:hypothetical protein
MKRCYCCLALLLGVVVPVLAQISSGPPVGEKLPPLKVSMATGADKEKEIEAVAGRAGKPTVYVLIRDWDRPVARFLKRLDDALHAESALGAGVAVWLTDQKDETKNYLPRAQQSLQLQETALGVFPGDRAGPDGWLVNLDARVTVVVAAKGKAAATFGYQSVNETDVRPVLMAFKKAAAD